MNKFITDKILGSLYDQNFMLKLMTLYDTIPVKDSNGRHQWTPANYIKGSAILLSIMNALICGKENKVCRLSKLLEKVAYFVPVVMMIHGDILVAREAYSSGKQSFIGPMEEMDSTKKARFCRTLIMIATKSASGLFASENEKINRSAVMMGDQAVKIRKMLITTKAENRNLLPLDVTFAVLFIFTTDSSRKSNSAGLIIPKF